MIAKKKVLLLADYNGKEDPFDGKGYPKKKVLLLADYNGKEDPFDGRGLENVVFGIGNPKICV